MTNMKSLGYILCPVKLKIFDTEGFLLQFYFAWHPSTQTNHEVLSSLIYFIFC